MTQSEATETVNAILSRLGAKGLLPPGSPVMLRGGSLVAEPRPEYALDWRPLWRPTDEALMPLDLEDFSVDVAAEQIARYRFEEYRVLRHRLESILAFFEGQRMRPIEEHGAPDSFLVGRIALKISETFRRGVVEFRVLAETYPLPELVEPGESARQSEEIDVTDMDNANILLLANRVD